ncbi:MAG: hypothetical protein NTV86_07195 [Planctomycetota bacterium]|nr:hypothetical protein [Planctomycetota bacterium]
MPKNQENQMDARIVGVHRVQAEESVYLIELLIPDETAFDWGEVTQEDPTQPRENWQVAYDEQPVPGRPGYYAFFLHYLDLSKPLFTPAGKMAIPAPTSLPAHLSGIRYESP